MIIDEHIDELFAKTLFELVEKKPNETQLSFVKQLMKETRNGSLCVFCPECDDLKELVGSIIYEINSDEKPSLPICKWNDFYYLQKFWNIETRIVNALSKLQKRSTTKIELSDKKEEVEVSEEQKKLFSAFDESGFIILSGGPGRGKTYVAAKLVSLLPNECHIVVSAPTGKATANLADKIHQFSSSDKIEALTLHGYLFKIKKEINFHPDILIVDEASMIDANIFAQLLESLHQNTRLLLLGDEQQLPSVEAGNVFSEVCKIAKQEKAFSYVHLSKCYRTDQAEIIDFAESIFTEKPLDNFDHFQSIDFYEISNFEESMILDRAKKYFVLNDLDPQKAMNSFLQFRFLSSLKVGYLGTDFINQLILDYMEKNHSNCIIPIMVTKTNYDLEIFNGEMGLKINDHILIPRGEHCFKELPAYVVDSYDLAYAISVHKSQGSEYERVCLVLPDGSTRFSKEMVYTGVTRTKKHIEIVSDQNVFNQCIRKKNSRASAISKRVILTRS